ncbi:MAG: SGNH/GDSL hydrolase family protein [Saprospiraceae bacterium]|jgi:lysophospholipase L1-like esterase
MNVRITHLLLSCTLVLICHTLVGQDWPNLNKYAEANTQITDKETGRVVFMGNSITEGWGYADADFFKGKPYVNRGISGQTTPQMLIRFRQDVVDLNPEAVVILAGTNDIAGNTGPSTLKMIADNIFSMAEIAHANGIKVVICSVLPVYDYPWKPGLEPAGKIIRLNQMLRNYADSKGHYYLDYHSAMKDERNGLPKEYATDEVHPTKEGYLVMGEMVETLLSSILTK